MNNIIAEIVDAIVVPLEILMEVCESFLCFVCVFFIEMFEEFVPGCILLIVVVLYKIGIIDTQTTIYIMSVIFVAAVFYFLPSQIKKRRERREKEFTGVIDISKL